MTFLAFETSTKHFSLAVFHNGKITAHRTLKLKTVLSDAIIPAIKKLLSSARLSLDKLDGFAVGLGPGSFTSLRVGLSTVKALAFATDKPVVGIPSLDALALRAQNKNGNLICTVSDARRNLLYACLYRKNKTDFERTSPYLLCRAEDLLKKISQATFFIGDGITMTKEAVKAAGRRSSLKFSFAAKKDWYPTAAEIALLAEERFKTKKFDDAATLIPLYLYPDDCQVGKNDTKKT